MTSILRWTYTILLSPAQAALSSFAVAGELHYLWSASWAVNFLLAARGIAFALLAVRTAWDAFQLATLRADGAPTDPGGLLKRVVVTACAIGAGPWLAHQMLVYGNDLAEMVANLGLVTALPSSLSLPSAGVGAAWALVVSLVLFAAGFLLVLLCFAQSMVRSVEMLLAALVSPILALGFMSGNDGTAGTWFRESLVLACTQAVQVTMLYVAATLLVSPGGVVGAQVLIRPFLFVGACWVAFRTPQILRQYAYHSGAGEATSSVAGQVTQRGLLSKLPF